MPSTKDTIASLLLESFTPEKLEIRDDSAKHTEHIETELDISHLSIFIVSKKFEGLSLVNRQRAINKILQPFFDKGLHAVQLNTKTPKEYHGK
ncbi:MAG: BolA family protein [bacterium]